MAGDHRENAGGPVNINTGMSASAVAAQPVIKIVVDTTAVPGAVNTVNSQLGRIGQGGNANGVQDMMNRLAAAFGNTGQAAAGAAAPVSNLQRLIAGLGGPINAALGQLASLGGAFTSIGVAGAAIGITATIGGLAALGAAAVQTSAKFESYKASLTTVLGDTDKAGQAFDRLTDFAAKTPFSLDQSVEGFIKLKALGLQPSEAAMTSYGNTASAMGKDLNQMVEAVADASTGEFERLKEFGIKASQEGDKVSMTFQGVTKTIGNNSTDIQKYLLAIGNTHFAGAMERQMQTFNGAASNLEDTWSQTLAAIGDAGLSSSVARVINMITDGITTVTPILVGLGNVMAGFINGFASMASGIGSVFAGMVSNGGQGLTFVETLTLALNVVGQTAEAVGNVIGGAFTAVGLVIGGIVDYMRNLFADVFELIGLGASKATDDMGLSFVGMLRAAKYLTSKLPEMFSIAFSTISGIFAAIGKRATSFFEGNFSAFDGMGDALAAQFNKGNAALGKIADKASAIANDSKGAAAAWDRLIGRKGDKGGATLDQLAGEAPKSTPKADNDNDKKAADALKKANDFWATLRGQVETSALLTLEAEKRGKELEFQKSVGREMNAGEKQLLGTLMSQVEANKAITGLRQATVEAANQFTVESQRAVGLTDQQRTVEDALFARRTDALNRGVDINSTAYQQAEAKLKKQLEENEALKARNALLAKAGDFARRYSQDFDMGAELAQMAKERDAFVEAWTKGGGIVDGQQVSKSVFDGIMAGYDQARDAIKNRPLLDALDAASRGGSLTAQAARDRMDAQSDYDRGRTALRSSGLSEADQQRAIGELTRTYNERMTAANRLVADDFAGRMSDGIRDFARLFGGSLGKLLDGLGDAIDNMSANANGSSGIAKMLGGIDATLLDGFKSGAQSMTDLKGGFENLGNPLKSLGDAFSGPNGSFMKGLGSAIGGAMQGYEMGSQIGGLMEFVGINNSNSGAKIGGAIGGATGNPIIAAAASVVGGLIGSVLHKPKYGSATITGGGADDITVTGNKSKYRKAAGSAADSVQEGLAAIAEQFGGVVGAFDVMIGQYEGKWRVRDTSSNMDSNKMNFKGSSAIGLHNFDDDAQAALEYAIQNAIEDGAITGISDLATKALKKLGADNALALVEAFTTVTDTLDSLLDPIGSAARNINKPLDDLIKQMEAVGASSTDLAKIEQLRSLQLEEARKQQTSTLDDLLKQIRGESSGKTALDLLNDNITEFKGYQDRIAAGDTTIDQSAFASLVQEILSGGGDVWGTATSQYQDLLAMVDKATADLRDGVLNAFDSAAGIDVTTAANDATSAAITAQTNAITSQQAQTNTLLTEQNDIQRQLLEAQAANAELMAAFLRVSGLGQVAVDQAIINGLKAK
ncbi:MAG: tape measure protein [Pseudomonadota bacterium]